MKEAIQKFIRYYHKIKKSSGNTEASYRRDLEKLSDYLESQAGVHDWSEVTQTHLNSYTLGMERDNYAPSSISRAIASMNAFFTYMEKKHLIDENPASELKRPKVAKALPQIMTVAEIESLLKQPDVSKAKGQRDLAMLELLYATGMRVSELIGIRVDDLNLPLNYVVCHDSKTERIIPFGKAAGKALDNYLKNARPSFIKEKESDYLFTNCSGGSMSRQGFWKLLKGCASDAGIEHEITPHTLRHSFASHMIQNGADLKSVQEMLGHTDITTTQMYVDLNLSHMKDVYAKSHPRK
ncbi:MAG: site-specific tyrosine recombinase XerD [Lachnospiraceae bacterium]|nr:site-specific tyrosine recombinase XerD [Candidatus Equihabitans merdae]